MKLNSSNLLASAQSAFHALAFGLLVAAAAFLSLTTLLAAAGVLPWPVIEIGYGPERVIDAGPVLQIALTVLLLGLCVFLPASGRLMRLENSHRSFAISMEDVARAYAASHQADRDGSFSLSSEFDSVRERILHLRNHPELSQLEPAILEVAAQMSHSTRNLAEIYSAEKVERAKAFLRQRQEEIADFQEKVRTAQMTCSELRRWIEDVKAEERVAEQQIQRLEKDLKILLPKLGYDFQDTEDTVVPMTALPSN